MPELGKLEGICVKDWFAHGKTRHHTVRPAPRQGGKQEQKRKVSKPTEWSVERLRRQYSSTKIDEDTEEGKTWRIVMQLEMNNLWKELCKEIDGQVLKKYEVERGKRGVQRGRGDEPQWFHNNDDIHVERGMRVKKQIGEQCWDSLASRQKQHLMCVVRNMSVVGCNGKVL